MQSQTKQPVTKHADKHAYQALHKRKDCLNAYLADLREDTADLSTQDIIAETERRERQLTADIEKYIAAHKGLII